MPGFPNMDDLIQRGTPPAPTQIGTSASGDAAFANLIPLLQSGALTPNATAPMPGPMALRSPQITQMPPGLPMSATPVRESGPPMPIRSGGSQIPWAEIARTFGPVIAATAMRGPRQTGFLQGLTHGQQIATQEQEKRRAAAEEKKAQASKFRLDIFDAAKQITDPQEWAQFVDLATDSALQMGFIQSPAEMKSFLTYPAHLEGTQKREAALKRLEGLMKSGYDLDELAEQNASVVLDGPKGQRTTYKVRELITIAGAMPEVNGKFVAPSKKPSEEVSLQRVEVSVNGKQQFANFNPKTGKFHDPDTGTAILGAVPYEKPVDPELVDMKKTLTQLQIDAARTRGQQAQASIGDLPKPIQAAVDGIARGFGTEPVVKTVQKAAEAVAFANGMDPNTTNPADDQALIYAFAKAMDPDSVVREGEYATVQKYSQSWADTYGFNVKRIFSNSPFLTPKTRADLKKTIQAKFAAMRGQYDNLRKSYAQRINKKTGRADGESFLTDYGGGFPDTAPPQGAPKRILYDANGDPK